MHEGRSLFLTLTVLTFFTSPKFLKMIKQLVLPLQECYKGAKYAFIVDEDTFTIIIKDPEVADSGRYAVNVHFAVLAT